MDTHIIESGGGGKNRLKNERDQDLNLELFDIISHTVQIKSFYRLEYIILNFSKYKLYQSEQYLRAVFSLPNSVAVKIQASKLAHTHSIEIMVV